MRHLLLLALVLTACSATGNVVHDEPLSVGLIAPLSGDYAVFGEEVLRGMHIAQKELAVTGQHIIIIAEDDQSFTPRVATTAANKLLKINDVDVLATLVIDEAKFIADAVAEDKTPLVVLWDSNEYINNYTYSLGFSTEYQGIVMAEHAYKALGARTAAVVEDLTPGAAIVCNAFRKRFTELGGSIVLHEQTIVGEADYRSLLTKIQTNNPDTVYLGILFPETFIQQAYDYNVQSILLSADSVDETMLPRLGVAGEGMYFTYMYVDDTAQMRSLYRVTFGEEPQNLHMVSLGYNGLHAIANASRAATVAEGLVQITGTDHALDKHERIYRAENSLAVLVY